MLEDLAITRNGVPVGSFSSPSASVSASYSHNGTVSSQVTSPTPSYAALHSDGPAAHSSLDPTTTPWVPDHGRSNEANGAGPNGHVVAHGHAGLGTEKEYTVPPVPHNTPHIPYSLFNNDNNYPHANPHASGVPGQGGQIGDNAGAA